MSVVSPVHDVGDARLHRIVGVLVERGLVVEVVGTGDPARGPRGARTSVRPRVGPIRRLLRAMSLPSRAHGRVLVTVSPDTALAAAIDRAVRGRPWVADVYEDYLPLLRDRSWARGALGLGARAVARLGDRLVAAADLTCVADEHVPPAVARARLVLRNLPDPSTLPTPSARGSVPRAVYIGDVRRSRGLYAMLAALEAAPAWSLDVVGPVAAEDLASVSRWRETSPAASRVRFHGRQAPEDAWRLASGAWVGFALLEDTPAFRTAMPSKVYEYAAAGLAVLATPLPRVAAALQEGGAGATASTGPEAARVLNRWAAHPEEVDRLRGSALTWWRTQSPARAAYSEFAQRVASLAADGRRLSSGRSGPAGP